MATKFDWDQFDDAAPPAPARGKAESFDWDQFEDHDQPEMIESLARGGAQGLSFGLADEATGAIESLFTDKTYEQARDESRKAYAAAEKANPKSYLVGDIGGSVATAFVPGLGALNAGKGARLAEVAGKAALQGGLTGFGKSEEESAGGLLKDTASGAVIGGALGTAGHGLVKGVQKGADLVGAIGGKGGLEHAGHAFREGAKQGREILGMDVSNVPIVSQISQGISGAKNALKEIGALSQENDALLKTFGPGGVKDLSDVDKMMGDLISKGITGDPTRGQQLVAAKFAQIHGGSAEKYLDILRRSPEELQSALGFDVIKAGEELAPLAQSAFDDMRQASGAAYEKLSQDARKNFHMKGSYPVGILNSALKEADRYESISDTTRKVLRDAMKDLNGHEGQPAWKDIKGPERFDRLLASKQRLSRAVKWASKNALSEDQQLLLDTQQKFNATLKKLDDMAAADQGYSTYKGVEDGLFKQLGTVKRGKIQEFDPIKLESLFRGSAKARGVAKQIVRVQELVDSGKLPKESEARLRAFLTKVNELTEKSRLKRDIESFKQANGGPTSMAVDRAAARFGKDSATMKAINSPRNFIGTKASSADVAKSMWGKTTGDLKPAEMLSVAKYLNWINNNPGVSDNQIANMMLKFKDPKFKP